MQISIIFLISALFLTSCATTSGSDGSGFVEDGKVYSIVNLHADHGKTHLYALNYQVERVIPYCSEFTIDDIGGKRINLIFEGQDWYYSWDGHTRKAGQSLEENFKLFFAKSCDSVKNKVASLSEIDKKGIEKGTALIGMSKEGVLIAMGRPPIHVNRNLDSNVWLYMRNKWVKDSVTFNDKGTVAELSKN